MKVAILIGLGRKVRGRQSVCVHVSFTETVRVDNLKLV